MKRQAGVELKLLSALWLACASMTANAADATVSKPGIYVCVDSHGRKITSDRPIPECLDRDQRLLNSDGSQKGVHERYMTATERSAYEDEQRRKQQEAVARMDAVRRDRNLLMRYPNEAAHEKARASALDDVRTSIEISKKRLIDLERERKPLLSEAEFYANKKLPAKLKRSLDDNEASAEAQKTLIQNQEVELSRVTALYDTELIKLKRLWAGAPPGSLEEQDRKSAASAAAAASKPASAGKTKGK